MDCSGILQYTFPFDSTNDEEMSASSWDIPVALMEKECKKRTFYEVR